MSAKVMIFFLLFEKEGEIFFDNPPTMKTFSILWNGGYPQTPICPFKKGLTFFSKSPVPFDFVDLCRDSAKLMQAWFCARYSIG